MQSADSHFVDPAINVSPTHRVCPFVPSTSNFCRRFQGQSIAPELLSRSALPVVIMFNRIDTNRLVWLVMMDYVSKSVIIKIT